MTQLQLLEEGTQNEWFSIDDIRQVSIPLVPLLPHHQQLNSVANDPDSYTKYHR